MALVRDVTWLRLALGVVYFLAGTMKLYPYHQNGYDYLVKKFTEYALVFPLAPIGIRPPADLYRITIGVAEAVMALLLMAGSKRWCHYSCLGLMFIMAGATQTVICNKDYSDIANPVSFFLALAWLLHLQKRALPPDGAMGDADDKESVYKMENDVNGNGGTPGETMGHNKDD